MYYPIEKRGSCVLCEDLHTFAKTAPDAQTRACLTTMHRRRPRVLASVPRRVATTTSWTSRTRHRSTRRLRPRARHRRLCRTLAGTRAPRTHSAPFTMLSSFRSSGRRASPTASPAAKKSAATPVASAVVAKILCSSRRPACACCYRRCSLGKSSVVTTSLCEPRRDPRPLPPPPTSFGAFLRHQCAVLRRSVSGSIASLLGRRRLTGRGVPRRRLCVREGRHRPRAAVRGCNDGDRRLLRCMRTKHGVPTIRPSPLNISSSSP